MKKIILIFVLFFSCYFIYYFTYDDNVNYLVIGDSISAGVNNYGIKVYGYSGYVKDYLNDYNMLKNYNDVFTSSSYRITDLIRMIEYNETKMVNGVEYNINKLIKDADIITLSLGMNELYYKFSVDNSNIYNYMNSVIDEMSILLELIGRLNKKVVFVLGYYDIFNRITEINYINVKLSNIVSKNGFVYVDLASFFNNNPTLIESKDSFIPNSEGYFKISKIIVEKLKNN